jgi:hypothetical protein
MAFRKRESRSPTVGHQLSLRHGPFRRLRRGNGFAACRCASLREQFTTARILLLGSSELNRRYDALDQPLSLGRGGWPPLEEDEGPKDGQIWLHRLHHLRPGSKYRRWAKHRRRAK